MSKYVNVDVKDVEKFFEVEQTPDGVRSIKITMEGVEYMITKQSTYSDTLSIFKKEHQKRFVVKGVIELLDGRKIKEYEVFDDSEGAEQFIKETKEYYIKSAETMNLSVDEEVVGDA